MEWLQKARAKSDSSKNKIALLLAGLVTLIIVSVWILVLRNQKTPDDAVTNSKKNELRPLFMIFKGAKEDLKDIRVNIKESSVFNSKNEEVNQNVLE